MPDFFRQLRKMSQNLSSATVVIGALRVKCSRITSNRIQSILILDSRYKPNDSRFRYFLGSGEGGVG